MESYLTPKQKLTLEFIESYLKENQTMPSRREIAHGLGLSSPATIQQHIESLEKKGFIKRGETRESRAIQWTSKSKKHFVHSNKANLERETSSTEFELPLMGSIAAGYPIEVYPDVKKVSIPMSLFLPTAQKAKDLSQFYVLTVRGDSMIDQGILQDDWVILNRTTQAKSGDTVAALLNGEATLKTFIKSKSSVELHPANPNYPVMKVAPDDRFEIQGILVGVIRRFQAKSAR